jgi:hypothetical protein
MPVVDPHSWEVLAFGDASAFTDFLGAHALWHRALDVVLRAAGGAPYPTLPLGDGGADEWHTAHQNTHVGEAAALTIAAPPDFQSYDLKRPDDFQTWTYLHAQEHVRLRQAAGL